MKNFLSSVLLATAALTSTAALAVPVNVGGVTWDPDAASDFSGVSAVTHQDIDAITGEVSGYGRVTTLNGTGIDTFCPGCELTFQFGGFTPVAGVVLPTANSVIDYAGGFLNLYVDFTPETDPNDHASLSLSSTGSEGGVNALWLGLLGHEVNGISFTGTVFGNFQLLAGLGNFDVVSGLAASNLDTNTVDDGNGGFADLGFTSSFSINVTPTSADGSANFQGNSIPEPSTLGVLGFGLIGLSALSRRRRSARVS